MTNTGLCHFCGSVKVKTGGVGFYRIGDQLNSLLAGWGAADGVLNLFVTHTSASLCVQENADPDVLLDLADTLRAIAPEDRRYRHASEGPDDMPAHIKAMLTATSLTLPVRKGRIAFGIWQEAYLIEHRFAAHIRKIEVDYIGKCVP